MLIRIVALALWVAIVVALARPAVRAFTRHAMGMDLIWALFFGLAANRIWFTARDTGWHAVMDTPWEAGVAAFGYLWAITMAVMILFARRWYPDHG